jgi:hypothetical protein
MAKIAIKSKLKSGFGTVIFVIIRKRLHCHVYSSWFLFIFNSLFVIEIIMIKDRTALAAGFPTLFNGTPTLGTPQRSGGGIFPTKRAYIGIRCHQLTTITTGMFISGHGYSPRSLLLIIREIGD